MENICRVTNFLSIVYLFWISSFSWFLELHLNWLLREDWVTSISMKRKSQIFHQNFFFLQVLPTTCAAPQVTSSTLIITVWTRTWSSHYATISLPHHTTPTWWGTSWCHSPEWTCTPGCCRPAAAVSKVSMFAHCHHSFLFTRDHELGVEMNVNLNHSWLLGRPRRRADGSPWLHTDLQDSVQRRHWDHQQVRLHQEWVRLRTPSRAHARTYMNPQRSAKRLCDCNV